MCAGDILENGRRCWTISLSDVRQELPETTTFAATHERRVHWNTAQISLRAVPIEIPQEISSRASLELEAWNHNATVADAREDGKVNQERDEHVLGK